MTRLFVMIMIAVASSADAQGERAGGAPGNAQGPPGGRGGGPPAAPAEPAPRRDLSGVWGSNAAAAVAPRGHQGAPLTPQGQALMTAIKPGDGPNPALLADINDPHTTLCDPAGFPRMLLFELRPFQVVQAPTQMLMLYTYERRWRPIWTDGRPLPADPDPRWYGYSVGRWADDSTFVVETRGTDDRTWLDNRGNPHSAALRVEERYHLVDRNTLELSVLIDDPQVYQQPWLARDKLRLTRMPADTEPLEMLCSASEAAEYRRLMAAPSR
jgi:hypothetical protein